MATEITQKDIIQILSSRYKKYVYICRKWFTIFISEYETTDSIKNTIRICPNKKTVSFIDRQIERISKRHPFLSVR